MVDRVNRDALFDALHRLRSGALERSEFAQIPRVKTRDLGVRSIQWVFWLWCDGAADHQRIDLHDETQAFFHRSLVFLGSTREYAWPRWRTMLPAFLRNIGTKGEFRYWPFQSADEFRLEEQLAQERSYRDCDGPV